VPFQDDLLRHLAAITARDLDALAATIDPDDVVLVAADGAVAYGRDEFLKRHGAWFAMPTWTLDVERLHERETAELATALLRLRYRDAGASPPVDEDSVLALIFRRRGDRWLLVQDQNTPIRRAP
jgi:uncharacterized protein (TIGR02246 family)